MSSPKPLHRYPEEYYALCRKAHTADVSIPFATKKLAISFRHEIYQFRVALRNALLADTENEELQLGVLFSNDLEFSIKETTLVISKKTTVHAEKIREVL